MFGLLFRDFQQNSFHIIQKALVFPSFFVCLLVVPIFIANIFHFVSFSPVWDMKIKPKRKQTSNKTSLFYRYKSSNSFFICFIIHEHFTSMIYLLDFLFLLCFYSCIFGYCTLAISIEIVWYLWFLNLSLSLSLSLVFTLNIVLRFFFPFVCFRFISAIQHKKNIQVPVKCFQHIEHYQYLFRFFHFSTETKSLISK